MALNVFGGVEKTISNSLRRAGLSNTSRFSLVAASWYLTHKRFGFEEYVLGVNYFLEYFTLYLHRVNRSECVRLKKKKKDSWVKS